MSSGLGIIGAGAAARLHADGARRAGIEPAAFCDLDAPKVEALAADHPGAVAVRSIDELLALDAVTAVVVALPNHLHAECATRALAAGKDVLLEKPMAVTVAECDRIIAQTERSGRLLQMGFVTRCSPTAVAVKRIVDAGRLGRVYHARVRWCRRRGIPGLGGWFTTRSRAGGGVLIDLGVHLIDLVLHLTGRPRPRRVSGACTSIFGVRIEDYVFTEMWAGPPRPDGVFDVEDGANALIRLDGLTMEVALAWAANLSEDAQPNGVTLLGDAGGCFFDPWGDAVLLTTEQDGALVDVRPQIACPEPWPTAWQRQHELFRDARATRVPTAPGRDGREVQAIIEAVYRSSAEEREVEVGREGTEGQRD